MAKESGGKDESSLSSATAEEEVLKRNTDCVYFLASPLTCKKGIECEYRHSEGARVNPRDCWFWLNGNCLNPKCSFRHPPLDGLVGTATTAGIAPPTQVAIPTRIPVSYPPAAHKLNKQSVPCYYFQMGACLKGDMCSFMHGPSLPKANPALQQVAKVSVQDSLPQQKSKKTNQNLGVFAQENILRSMDDPPVPPAVVNSSSVQPVEENGPPNVTTIKGNMLSDVEISPRSQTSSAPVSSGHVPSGPESHQSENTDDGLQDDKEADEFFHESSPGFDVLVDHVTEDPMYYHDDEEFRDHAGHDKRLNPASDFGHGLASEDDMFERSHHNEMSEYGKYMQTNDQYGLAYSRGSPDRIVDRSYIKRPQREETPIEIDGYDLRHQLLERRRHNKLKPGITSNMREAYERDRQYSEEHNSRGHDSHRERSCFPCEGAISKRLQGRLVIPRTITTDNSNDAQSSRGTERERIWGRSSPGRPTNNLGRLHMENGRKHRAIISSEDIKSRARSTQRDEEANADFNGPKSLSELKVTKTRRTTNDESDVLSREEKKRRMGKTLDHQEADSKSFVGPMPLSMILKRKRKASLGSSGTVSSNEDVNNHKVGEGTTFGSVTAAPEGSQIYGNVSKTVVRVMEKEEEYLLPSNGNTQQLAQSSSAQETLEGEGCVMMDHMEDPDENYDQGYGEFDYEADEGGEFKTEDYENTEAYQEDEEYLDDEDGNDFSQKVGVMFS